MANSAESLPKESGKRHESGTFPVGSTERPAEESPEKALGALETKALGDIETAASQAGTYATTEGAAEIATAIQEETRNAKKEIHEATVEAREAAGLEAGTEDEEEWQQVSDEEIEIVEPEPTEAELEAKEADIFEQLDRDIQVAQVELHNLDETKRRSGREDTRRIKALNQFIKTGTYLQRTPEAMRNVAKKILPKSATADGLYAEINKEMVGTGIETTPAVAMALAAALFLKKPFAESYAEWMAPIEKSKAGPAKKGAESGLKAVGAWGAAALIITPLFSAGKIASGAGRAVEKFGKALEWLSEPTSLKKVIKAVADAPLDAMDWILDKLGKGKHKKEKSHHD